MDANVCATCSAAGERVILAKCPICFKMICEKCRVFRSGRTFCSQRCADHFFFDDED